MKCFSIVDFGVIAITVAWHFATFDGFAVADDWPMLGRDGTRNSVSTESGVEDKADVADDDRDVAIFGLSANPTLAFRKEGAETVPIAEIPMENSICSSPVCANGVLYVATGNKLSAISGDNDQPEPELTGGSWPQWRGPNRDNVSPETGLLKEWPVGGPPMMWRAEGIGEGIASVSITDGRIYTLGYFEGGEFLTALDQRTAQRVWATRLGPRVNENPLMRWLSQRSPTLDEDRLYAITTGGRLVCLQTSDGTELWSRNYPDDFASPRPRWGFCDYPLVDGDALICTPGGPQASVVALDKRTGKELWRSLVPSGGQSAYAALVVSEVGGIRQYVAFLEKSLVGLRASDGHLLWSYYRIVNGIANTRTPIVSGDSLFVSNGYGVGHGLLKLVADGEDVKAQEQYFQQSGLDTFQDSSVVVGDYLYAGTGVLLMCLDCKSGETVWRERRVREAILYAEDRIYLRNSNGLMTLADPSPTEFVERGSFQIPDSAGVAAATAHVIAGGRLYLRDDNKLFCYDIREQAFDPPLATPRTIVLEPLAAMSAKDPGERTLRSVFVPTPQDIVKKMLELAAVKKTDVVCDLGSGDGRIVITAAQKYGCRAIGYELDRELVDQSRMKAEAAGVQSLVTIEAQDLFTADLSEVDVLAVYLLPQQLEKLLPRLEKMKPGSRLISHQFEIPGVPANKVVNAESLEDGAKHTLYLWTLPLKKANK